MQLPTNIKAERSIIGCIVLGGADSASEAGELVDESVFFDDTCAEMFRLLKRMANNGEVVDLINFDLEWRRLRQGNQLPDWFNATLDEIPSPANLPQYAQDARRTHQNRQLYQTLVPPSEKASEGIHDPATLLHATRQKLDALQIDEVAAASPKTAVQGFVSYLESLHNLQGRLSGIETGFYDLDKRLCGLQFGEQTVIAARPSQGKTAIGLNIAAHVCLRSKVPTLIISAEMSRNALLRRMLSSWARIEMNILKAGGYDQGTFNKIIKFGTLATASPLYIVEACNGIDCNKVGMLIHHHARKHGVKMVVIDYLQKLKAVSKAEKRTYEIAEVSGELKSVAVKTNVALLTLAQLNRESEKDKGRVPRISDLADSGQIERDADTVLLIHRPRTNDDPDGAQAKIIIGKNRDGETGIVNLRFDGRFCEFQNVSPSDR